MPERLVLQSTGEVVGAPLRRARTRLERARGLLGTAADAQGPLLFEGARQVHTFGMRYPIDVVFCDGEWRVVHVVNDMKPNRITRWVRAARVTIELASAGRAVVVRPGDALLLESY